MRNLNIGRYDEPKADIFADGVPVPAIRAFSGWIEPDDRAWIIFLGPTGAPALYWAKREASGAVIGAPVELAGLVEPVAESTGQ